MVLLVSMVPTDQIKSLPNLTPILITIDPDRDTAEALATYVKGAERPLITLSVCGSSSGWRLHMSHRGQQNMQIHRLVV